jgi:hypothetical protein
MSNKPARMLAAAVSAMSLSMGAHAAVPADHARMLRDLIQDATQGHIRYETLSPGLAEAVRPQAATAQSELAALGSLQSMTLQTRDANGTEIYRTVFEKGALDWAFHVDAHGLIDNAIWRPVTHQVEISRARS